MKLRTLLPAALLACVAGCGRGSPPQPADPDRARAALRLALDAWQQGQAPRSLQGREPPVRVIDREWRAGYKLVRYELAADGPLGADLRCQVRLLLRNGRGQAVRKKAVYSVGTSPALTVVREEDP
jgi:hypothetical protein